MYSKSFKKFIILFSLLFSFLILNSFFTACLFSILLYALYASSLLLIFPRDVLLINLIKGSEIFSKNSFFNLFLNFSIFSVKLSDFFALFYFPKSQSIV